MCNRGPTPGNIEVFSGRVRFARSIDQKNFATASGSDGRAFLSRRERPNSLDLTLRTEQLNSLDLIFRTERPNFLDL